MTLVVGKSFAGQKIFQPISWPMECSSQTLEREFEDQVCISLLILLVHIKSNQFHLFPFFSIKASLKQENNPLLLLSLNLSLD